MEDLWPALLATETDARAAVFISGMTRAAFLRRVRKEFRGKPGLVIRVQGDRDGFYAWVEGSKS